MTNADANPICAARRCAKPRVREAAPRSRGEPPARGAGCRSRTALRLAVVFGAACVILLGIACDSGGAPTSRTLPSGNATIATIASEPDPLRCRLVLHPTGITLRADEQGSHPDPGLRIARDGDGRFFTTTGTPGEIAVWDPTGAFVRVIGRRGGGPTEFQGIRGIAVDRADRLHVFHGGNNWSIVDTSLEILLRRTTPDLMHSGNETVVLSNGGLIVVGGLSVDGARRFHRLDDHGEEIATFELGHAGQWNAQKQRTVPSSTGSRFWAGVWRPRAGQYSVMEIDPEGGVTRTIVRSTSRLPEDAHQDNGPDHATTHGVRGSPPPPYFSLYQYGDSMLYVGYTVPNARWSESSASDPDAAHSNPRETLNRFYDVITTGGGRVLASGQWDIREPGDDQHLSGIFPGTQIGYRRYTSRNGLPVVDVLAVRLFPTVDGSGDGCR